MRFDPFVPLRRALAEDRLSGADVGARLCASGVAVLGVAGAGITLLTDADDQGTAGVSDPVIAGVAELEFALGEGPGLDAFRTRWPVFEPDLAVSGRDRWLAFGGPAVAAGVGAVFGFPLRVGPRNFGVLSVYLDHPGGLSVGQIDDARVLVEVIAVTVLAVQREADLGRSLPQWEACMQRRAVVHQATGMTAGRFGIPVADALARIRAAAYSSNRPINDVAGDIADRRLDLGCE